MDRSLERAAVVGAGTMGTGIAMVFANAGIPVALTDSVPEALERARATIDATYRAAATKGRIDDAERTRRTAAIAVGDDLAIVRDADLIVEAVFEDLAIKRALFERLDAVAGPATLLATNTSYLDVDAIAAAASHPERTLGLHFFSPAHVMKLVEVVRAAATAPATIDRALELAHRLGKIAVVAGNCDGFIGNRMLLRYKREAELLLEAGATPAQIDGALRAFGFAMGPFAMSDLAGLDVGWRAKAARTARGGLPFRQSEIPDRLVAAGRFGQKTAAGWYRYETGSRTPIADKAVDAIVAAERARLGTATRAITDDEIVDRCIYALVNEGARLLGESVARSAADIDTVWLNGYGFPRDRGGPMQFADARGLDRVVGAIRRFGKADPVFWEPAPALLDRAARGEPFISHSPAGPTLGAVSFTKGLHR
ncbi:MAG: 3-hydroxyacyl-CoA dehydrogenase NAD-binding domain-containing protein [Vulcanimicrobiaceae bacterium]